MKVLVLVVQWHNQWQLVFLINGQVSKSYTRKKLIEVLDLANELQVHVSNADCLPLSQYRKAA